MSRPWILVLAGVNGAGKSSVGGDLLRRSGRAWFNPDDYARDLLAATGCSPAEANAEAWQEGMRRLERAIAAGRHHAFETTLGGNTVAATLRKAAASHDLMMWFCGLDSAERHITRVHQRVTRGGHDIPEAKIHERYARSVGNLVALLPHLARLQVYDNSVDALIGQPMPNPRLLLQTDRGRITFPTSANELRQTPDWAKPVLEAALQLQA